LKFETGAREDASRDSPSTPPCHNPAFKIDLNHEKDDIGEYVISIFLLAIEIKCCDIR
jgi:hypothetical protein